MSEIEKKLRKKLKEYTFDYENNDISGIMHLLDTEEDMQKMYDYIINNNDGSRDDENSGNVGHVVSQKVTSVTTPENIEKKDLRYYAKVHSIESFGAVDGPGIRFVLFLQGCNLKCKYCHNRDTWDMRLGSYKSLDEVFDKIMRYKNYIYPNGGVTITGGEPLLQAPFLIELFTKLKEENIHTCIDTSGMVVITEEIKKLLSLTDLVLLDIKHIDPEKSKALVGTSNKLELEFAKYLSDNSIPVWIRQVLVPGYTDDKEDLEKLKTFLSTLTNVKKIELLPYHSIGKYKWEKLGVKYELEDVRDANNNDIKRAKEILDIL